MGDRCGTKVRPAEHAQARMIDDVRDPAEIGRRLLRPVVDAERVSDVRGVLGGLGSASAAIEACTKRGLMPDTWWTDRRRAPGVGCSACGGRGEDEAFDWGISQGMWPCEPCAGAGYRDREWTVELVTAIACDPSGIEAAEQLAMEASRRMTPDLASPTAQLRWGALVRLNGFLCLETRGKPDWLGRHAWYWSLLSRLCDEAKALRSKITSLAPLTGRDDAIRAVADHAAFELEWTRRASAGEQPFASALDRNPFTPIVDLWLSGYALDGIAAGTVCLASVGRMDDHNEGE
jgi:hypothetical protein